MVTCVAEVALAAEMTHLEGGCINMMLRCNRALGRYSLKSGKSQPMKCHLFPMLYVELCINKQKNYQAIYL